MAFDGPCWSVEQKLRRLHIAGTMYDVACRELRFIGPRGRARRRAARDRDAAMRAAVGNGGSEPDPVELRCGKPSSVAAGIVCVLAGFVVLQAVGCRCGSEPEPVRASSNGRPRVPAPRPVRTPFEVDVPDAGLNLPVFEEKEPNNWPRFAQKIHPGVAARGWIGKPLTSALGDRDAYCFELRGTSRQTIRARVTGVPKLKLSLQVRTMRWVRLASVESAAVGRGLVMPNMELKPGRYCLVVGEARTGPPHRYNREQSYLLNYTVHPLRPGEEREPNDDWFKAGELRPGASVKGLLGHPGDEDWFRVPLRGLPPDSLLALTFEGVGGVSADVVVMNYARRTILKRRGTRGSPIRIRDLQVALHTGVVFVRVTAHKRFSTDEYYRLHVQATRGTAGREVEPNDSARQAMWLRKQRGQIAGTIEVAHDTDYFQLRLPVRSNIRVELQPPEGLDAKIAVFDMRGRKLGEADAGKDGEAELLPNVRAAIGVRIKVSGSKRSFNSKHSYRLSWVATPADRGDEREPNNTQKQAMRIFPGVSARGFIFPMADVDYYRFSLRGGLGATHKIRLAVQGVPRVRLELALLDDQGNVLARSALASDEGLRQLDTTVHAAKTYFVRLRDAKNRRVNANVNYELTFAVERR